MKTLLVSVDFSASTRAVVNAATELAPASDTRWILHHSVMPPMITTEYGLGADMLREAIEIGEKSARHQLEHLEDELTARGFNVNAVLTHGHPATNILALAEKGRADMIVMGSHGHTAFYELLIGGTTHAVLKKAGCPVLIVPSAAAKKSAKPKDSAKKGKSAARRGN